MKTRRAGKIDFYNGLDRELKHIYVNRIKNDIEPRRSVIKF